MNTPITVNRPIPNNMTNINSKWLLFDPAADEFKADPDMLAKSPKRPIHNPPIITISPTITPIALA